MKRTSLLTLVALLGTLLLWQGQPTLNPSRANGTVQVYLPMIQQGPTLPTTAAFIGPGGGAIADLVFDSQSPYVVYAAANGSGVYKSSDGGLTWQRVSDGLGSLDLTAIDVAPGNNQVLYAGTYYGGVYKSSNGGDSWSAADAGIQSDAITYAIEVDPATTSRVYLATRGLSTGGGAPWNGVVYRTTNGGGNWSAVLSDVGGTSQEDWAYDLAIHPLNPNVVYAATHEHGAYRSTDYGSSWDATNGGITSDKGLTARTIEPDFTSAYPGVVYMGVFERTGLFKSTNGGTYWTLYDHNLSDAQLYKLSIDPNNKNTLYLATHNTGVMKSTNAGVNWYSAGMSGEILLDVVVHPGDSSVLLSATIDNGLWRSTNAGGSWAPSQTGLNASSVSSIAVQAGDSQLLFAGLSPGWTQHSEDGGATWSDFHDGLPSRNVNALVFHPTETLVLYALTESAGMFIRHTTLSPSWSAVGSGLPAAVSPSLLSPTSGGPSGDFWDDYLPGVFESRQENTSALDQAPLRTMVFAPTDPPTAYVGTAGSGVYKSSDDGFSFSPSGLDGLIVRCLEVAPDDAQIIYACTDGSGSVRRTTNGGGIWTSLNLPSGTANDLAIPAANPGVFFAASDVGVYKYASGWTASGLAGQHVTAIAAHPLDGNLVYAGTTSGAYLSDDGGATWQPGPPELDGVWVRSIHIDPNDPDQVYWTTYWHSVLRLSP